MSNYYEYYLLGGTAEELRNIARTRNIDPKRIRLVNRLMDIHGYRGGKILYGSTGTLQNLEAILQYARAHSIEVP